MLGARNDLRSSRRDVRGLLGHDHLGRFLKTDYQSNSGKPGEGNNHRMYCTSTKNFESFTPTQLFYDP